MYIQITNRCNMTCDHCCFSCTTKGKDMSMKTFVKACELAASYGHNIAIGGGEPTLHKQFWAFIGLALAHSEGRPWMATNGSITETAVKLARLAKSGVMGVALSQDPWHDPIDQEVLDAFGVAEYHQHRYRNRHDGDEREIRDVSGGVSAKGRAIENDLGDDDGKCTCSDLFVDPYGKIYACGCRTLQLGTVDDPKIPGYDEAEWLDYGCPVEWQRNQLDEAA